MKMEITDQELLNSKLLLRPDEVAGILRLSRSKVYKMVELSQLESVKIGESIRIKTESVIALLEG